MDRQEKRITALVFPTPVGVFLVDPTMMGAFNDDVKLEDPRIEKDHEMHTKIDKCIVECDFLTTISAYNNVKLSFKNLSHL